MSDLDALFDQARAEAPGLSPGLAARILADAEAVQAEGRPRPAPARRPARPGLFAALAGLFGGTGPLASGMLAGVAGLALGYLQPGALSDIGTLLAGGAVASETQTELMPGFEALFTEE